MCIAAIAWDAHPHWRLVVAANRDESHDRPTAPLARWNDGSGIIAGRDLRSGGTWLGLTEGTGQSGRFALVTNFRVPGQLPDPARPSRGALVTALLVGTDPEQVPLGAYNPCNLLVANPSAAEFLASHPAPLRLPLTPGIHGLSNGPLDPPWLKTRRLSAALTDWLGAPTPDFAPLFAALLDRTPTETELSGAGPDPVFSSIFIANPAYGTRCSTIVAIDRAGNGRIIERSFGPDGHAAAEVALDFRWS